MGGGIAQVLALHGYKVALGDVDGVTAERARVRLVEQARGFEAHGLLGWGRRGHRGKSCRCRQHRGSGGGGGLHRRGGAGRTRLKAGILRRISAEAPAGYVIGSNTSAIPIGELALSVAGPERLLGVHWMNPAPFIPGVELIPGSDTDPAVLNLADEAVRLDCRMRTPGQENGDAQLAPPSGLVCTRGPFSPSPAADDEQSEARDVRLSCTPSALVVVRRRVIRRRLGAGA
jgi:hypothetical protein